VLQNSPVPALNLPGVTLTISELDIGEARNDLKLDLTETPEGIKGFLEYKTDLFEAATIARMAELFQLLLNRVVEQPGIQLSVLAETLAIAEEQEQLSKEKEFQEARRQKLGNIQRKVITNSIQEIS
jgi:non-ribosomal peptide synthetase component F